MLAKFQARTSAIECDHCAVAIKRSLSRLTGVRSVDVDVANKSVSVQYESAEVDEAGLRDRLALAGFPAE